MAAVELVSDYRPTRDQPEAIAALVAGFRSGQRFRKGSGRRVAEMRDLLVIDDVRRHQVDGGADRADEGFAGQCGAVKTVRKIGVGAAHVEGDDHPALAQMRRRKMET